MTVSAIGGGGAAAAIGIGAGAPPAAGITALASTGAPIYDEVGLGVALLGLGLLMTYGLRRKYRSMAARVR